MKINFNNVRKQACYSYDRLMRELNSSQEHEGYILVDPIAIQSALNDLRSTLGSIAMTYEDDNPEFKDVFSEVYPEPKTMPTFKFEEE